MEEFGSIRWFIKDNEVSTSLMNWYVSIDISMNNKNLLFPLKVYKGGKVVLTFNFYTFEDAIGFTNNVVNKSWSIEDIVLKYQTMFSENCFVGANGKKDKVQDSFISLTPEEVDQAIIDYFGSGKSYRVSCKEELSIYNGEPDIAFYLIEHLEYDGIKKDISTLLTIGDLMNALGAYINFYGYELLDFKYEGGVHKPGYTFDDFTPYYNGIRLHVKKKEQDKGLRLKRKDVK